MKKFLLSILLLTTYCYSQEENADQILFEKGTALQMATHNAVLYEFLDSKNKDKSETAKQIRNEFLYDALYTYKELIKNYPESKYLFDTLYQKGNCEFVLEDFKNAKDTFKSVIDFPTTETFNKNSACISLAEITIIEKDYKTAIEYLDQSKKFEVQHTCGNAANIDEEKLQSLYKKCNDGLAKR